VNPEIDAIGFAAVAALATNYCHWVLSKEDHVMERDLMELRCFIFLSLGFHTCFVQIQPFEFGLGKCAHKKRQRKSEKT
jgi:hypothetical protein